MRTKGVQVRSEAREVGASLAEGRGIREPGARRRGAERGAAARE
jgi:hypothetical protein